MYQPRRTKRGADYPRMVYGPHGASMVIYRAEDWPDGWAATPDGAGTAPRAEPEKSPYPRAELKRMLRETGVAFPENAPDIALYRLLPK